MRRKSGIVGSQSMITGNAYGTLCMLMVLVLGVCVASSMLLKGIAPIDEAKWSVNILLVVGVFVGTKISNLLCGMKKAVNAGIQCAAAMLVLLMVHIGFVNGPLINVGLCIGCILLGGVCAILTEMLPSKTRKIKRNR